MHQVSRRHGSPIDTQVRNTHCISMITNAVLFRSSLTGTTFSPSGFVPMKVKASSGLPRRVRSRPSLALNRQKLRATRESDGYDVRQESRNISNHHLKNIKAILTVSDHRGSLVVLAILGLVVDDRGARVIVEDGKS
jgi:hypothetical protein